MLEFIILFMLLFYVPYALSQIYLMFCSILFDDRKSFMKERPRSVANDVIVEITTNGMATDVVEKIIRKVRSYNLVSEIFVVKEARDTFNYSCREIVVPADYVCRGRSRNKMRAMQYGIEALHAMGYGEKTYICHLDDDSVVDKPYLMYVKYYLRAEGAQGCIRLRAFGRHLFSSLSDLVRISNCETWCKYCNSRNAPLFVHGEGIVIRADVEYDIGWDYGTYGAEDLMMGLSISKKYRFAHIPIGNIYIAPPTTAKDYYKQRRRWFWSILNNDGKVRALSIRTYLFYVYMYINGVLGLTLLLAFPFILLFMEFSILLMTVAVVNVASFYAYYQFGASYMHSLSISVLTFILQIPVAFYDGVTILYALVKKPDFTTFETIKKV